MKNNEPSFFVDPKKIMLLCVRAIMFLFFSFGVSHADGPLVEDLPPAPFHEKEVAVIPWGTAPGQVELVSQNVDLMSGGKTTYHFRPGDIKIGPDGEIFLLDSFNRDLLCLKDGKIKFSIDFRGLQDYFKDDPDEYALGEDGSIYLMDTELASVSAGNCLVFDPAGQEERFLKVPGLDTSQGPQRGLYDLTGIRFIDGAIYNEFGKKMLDVDPSARAPQTQTGFIDEVVDARTVYLKDRFYVVVKWKAPGGDVLNEFKYPTNLFFHEALYESGKPDFFYVGLRLNLKVAPQIQDFLILRKNGEAVGLLKTKEEQMCQGVAPTDFSTDPNGNIFQVYSDQRGVHVVEFSPSF